MAYQRKSRSKPSDNSGQRYVIPRRRTESGHTEYYADEETESLLRKYYPIEPNRVLIKWFHVSVGVIERLATALGIKKDMKVIGHKNAMAGKRTCTRNGYYDSIKGKKPSQATLDGLKRLREAGHNPIRKIREEDPRRFKRLVKKQSRIRKELIQTERRRYALGMIPQSNLPTYLYSNTSYSPYQTHARSFAKSHGYVLGSIDPDEGERTTIFYTDETDRRPQFESFAAEKGGFDFQPIHRKLS